FRISRRQRDAARSRRCRDRDPDSQIASARSLPSYMRWHRAAGRCAWRASRLHGQPGQGGRALQDIMLPGGLDARQAIFLVIVATALVLFIRGRPRIDVTAMLVLLSLTFTGLLEPREALPGFTSEPAIIVASVFVMAA